MVRNPYILRLTLICPKGAIHIGGGVGQDGSSYKKLGVLRVLWGEIDKKRASVIRDRFPNDLVINKEFGGKNSDTTVDIEIKAGNLPRPLMMVVDTDGADLDVLSGAVETLKVVKYLVLEQHLNWEDGKWAEKLTKTALSYGFRKTLARPSYNGEYEDVLYTRRTVFSVFLTKVIDNFIGFIKHAWHLRKGHKSTTRFFCRQCDLDKSS